jgi:HlyD family secretion protein
MTFKFNLQLVLKSAVILWLAVCVFSISSCSKEQTNAPQTTTKEQIITAKIQASVMHLFYSGNIQPIKTENITSPADGVVENLYFNYGDQVSQGQVLMTISSTKSQQDYATALTNYIKDKDQYLRNKSNFEGSTALYKTGIIDREDYATEKSQLATSELAYINSSNALKAIIAKMPNPTQNIETLTLSNISNLEKTLAKQYNQFRIAAPISGIALTPEKSGSDSSGGNKTLSTGSEIKQNQILVSIGDMAGISVTINVSETDVNKIAPGQTAMLTSSALPGMLFSGEVTSVGKQAKSNESGGLATFPVIIVVPQISPVQREIVKVGMSVKVDLSITNPPQIKIPIAAIFTSPAGEPSVTIIDSKTGKKQNVVVEPGTTDVDSITILNGLKEGDKVVVPGIKFY